MGYYRGCAGRGDRHSADVGERNQRQIAQTFIEAIDLTQVPDGTFTGRCNAFPVIAQVQVAVKDHEITSILLEQHLNGQGGGAEVIPDRVVQTQSLLVDTASGATYSSKVILLAIRDALQKAIGK